MLKMNYKIIHTHEGRYWESKLYKTYKQALKNAKILSKKFNIKLTKNGNLRIVRIIKK